MIKLVAFDWNGTLLSDTQTVVDACNQFIKALGGKPVTLQIYREKFIVPVIDFYESIGLNRETVLKNSQKNAQIFHEFYELRAIKLRTRANTKSTLAWLTKNKIKSVIFSNHVTHRIQEQIDRLNLSSYIEKVIANTQLDQALKGRNKKEKLEQFVKSKKLNFSQVLIVGDSSEEVEIAKELGSISVAITHGHYSTKRIKAAKPDYLINNLKEIIKIINNF